MHYAQALRAALHSHPDAFSVSGESFFCCEGFNQRGELTHAVAVEMDYAAGSDEVVGGQAGGESGGAAGRQDVRRTGAVVAQRNRRVRSEENRPGVVQFGQKLFGVVDCNVEVFRRNGVADLTGVVRVLSQNQSPKIFQTLPSQVAPAELSEHDVQLADNGV